MNEENSDTVDKECLERALKAHKKFGYLPFDTVMFPNKETYMEFLKLREKDRSDEIEAYKKHLSQPKYTWPKGKK